MPETTPDGRCDERWKKLLEEKGIKDTRQRLAVWEVLSGSEVPLTAEEIFLSVQKHCPNLSFSTVYRVLDTFCEKDVVTKSGLMEGGKALYEITPPVHRHNLICIRCHRIIPLQDCPLGEYEDNIEKTTGYTVSGHKLEVYGICPQCK